MAAQAAPSSFIYQGQIIKSNGSPLSANPTTFTVQIVSPGTEACVLYEEKHTLNMTGSEGVFSLAVGTGLRVGADYEDTSILLNIFLNTSSITGITHCSVGTSYSPSGLADRRKLRLSYNDGSGDVTLAQDHNIQSVPFAWDAKTIDGLAPANFVQINALSNITQAKMESLFVGTNYSKLLDFADGTAPVVTSSANGAAIPGFVSDPGSPPVGSVWVNTTSNELKYNSGTGVQVVGSGGGGGDITKVIAGTGLTGGATSGDATLNVDIGTSVGKLFTIDAVPHCTAGQKIENLAGPLYGFSCVSEGIPTVVANIAGDTKMQVEETLDEDKIRFDTAGSERLIIDNTGKVGIGTTAPTILLGFGGDSTQTIGMERHPTANTSGNSLTLRAGGATVGASNKAGGDLILAAGASTGTANYVGSNVLLQASAPGLSGTTTDVPATTVTSAGWFGSGIPNLKVGYQGTYNAPFGIGFSGGVLPYASLSATKRYVSDDTVAGVHVLNRDPADDQYSYYQMTVVNSNLNQQTAYMAAVANTGAGVYTPSLVFGSSSGAAAYTEKMRIDATGNVGIATNSPGAKLDVNGTVAVKAAVEGVSSSYVATGASYVIPDASLNIRRLSLTANTTIELPVYTNSSSFIYSITIFLKQDATGGRTVAFTGNGTAPDTIKWDSGAVPQISTTPNAISVIQLMKPSDETVWYGSMVWREN